MPTFLSGLGISPYDIALIILCPIGGVIGSFANAIHITINPDTPPNDEEKEYIASKKLQAARGIWIILRLTLGAILGFVIGLYFIGAIQENVSTVAKIMALCILAGYAAPKIWVAQENALLEKFGTEKENH